MDDVDAVQAQIAHNMISSGDWVTARLDGIPYLEKSPLVYWLIAISFQVFGVHDWAASTASRYLRDSALLGNGAVCHVGGWHQSGALRWTDSCDVCRAVLVYAGLNSRRDSDADDRPGDVRVHESA